MRSLSSSLFPVYTDTYADPYSLCNNPTDSLTFLKSLYDEKMLRYNSDSMSWVWNNVDVNRKEVTSNVANILVDKLNRLTESQKNILMIAGSLGCSFDKSIIATVITSLLESESETVDWRETSDSLDQSIDELEQEGLWERDSSNENKWRFSHDKIQQVAFELIPIEQRDSFQGEIGSIMLDKLASKELESNIFQVVSLRNCTIASLSDDDDRIELARLNLRAGMKVSMFFRLLQKLYCVIVHLFLTKVLYAFHCEIGFRECSF